MDTNVERLLSRFFGEGPDEVDIQDLADDLTPPERSSDFLHAMLNFAAAVCTAQSPSCSDCLLRSGCDSPEAGDGTD